MAAENILYSKGEPLKKRTFVIELTQDTYRNFIEMVYRDGVTPAEVLEGFINDLVCGSHTRGSDERMYAEKYYDRCGYGYFFDMHPCSFVQWLLREHGNGTVKRVSYAIDDIKNCDEETAYLTEHPEECDEGELQSLEVYRKSSTEQIKEYFDEYEQNTESPEPLEKALEGVTAFMALVNDEGK